MQQPTLLEYKSLHHHEAFYILETDTGPKLLRGSTRWDIDTIKQKAAALFNCEVTEVKQENVYKRGRVVELPTMLAKVHGEKREEM